MMNRFISIIISFFLIGCASSQPITGNPGAGPITGCTGCPPIIGNTALYVVQQAVNQTVYQSSTVTLTALAAGGSGAITVTWFVGGSQVVGNSFTANVTTSAYPVFKDALNASIQGSTIVITVQPTITITNPSNVVLSAGQTAAMSIYSTGGTGGTTYRLFKNGSQVSTTNPYTYTAVYADSGLSFNWTATDNQSHVATSATSKFIIHDTSSTQPVAGMHIPFTTTATQPYASIGIYKAADTSFEKQIMALKKYSPGNHDTIWNGQTEVGQFAANGSHIAIVTTTGIQPDNADDSAGTFFKLLPGAFNSSTQNFGYNRWRGTQMSGLEIIGTTGISFATYLEANQMGYIFKTNNPNYPTPYGVNMSGTVFGSCNDDSIAYGLVSSDYVNYSIIGRDTLGNSLTFSQGAGSNGEPFGDQLAHIPYHVYTIAAMKKGQGNLVFASVPSQNIVKVYTKTGRFVKNISATNATRLACDRTNHLWIDSVQYVINADTTIVPTGKIAHGILFNLGMSVSPDNAALAIVDGDYSRQQIKFFSNSTGDSSKPSLGIATGYLKNAVESKYRFAINIAAPITDNVNTLPFVAYEPTGGLWLNDCYSFRELHFDPTNTYKEQIAYLPITYSGSISASNPHHVFSHYLRATHDFVNPAFMDRNWFAMIDPNTQNFTEIVKLVEMSGKTFVTTRIKTSDREQLYEFTDTSARFIQELGYRLSIDDSLNLFGPAYFGASFQRFAGLDGSNNPTWGTSSSYIGFSIPVNQTGSPNASMDSIPAYVDYFPRLPNGDLIIFNPATIGHDAVNNVEYGYNGWHGGLVSPNGTSFKTLFLPSTGRSYFGDYVKTYKANNGNGTNYPMGALTMTKTGVFNYGHHGEFWNSSGQTHFEHGFNKYLQPLYVLGRESDGFLHKPANAGVPWGAGNSKSMIRQVDDSTYMVGFTDESFKGIYGLAKIIINDRSTSNQFVNLTKTSDSLPTYPYKDLMAGLPIGGSPAGGSTVGNWKIYGTTNSNFYTLTTRYATGPSNDMYVHFATNIPNGQDSVSLENISNSGVANWTIDGNNVWPDGAANNNNSYHGYLWVDLQDNNYKTIARIEMTQLVPGDQPAQNHVLQMNGQTVWTCSPTDSYPYTLQKILAYFKLSYSSGMLSYTQNGNTVSAPVFTTGADGTKPTRLVIHSYAGSSIDERIIDFTELKFWKTAF